MSSFFSVWHFIFLFSKQPFSKQLFQSLFKSLSVVLPFLLYSSVFTSMCLSHSYLAVIAVAPLYHLYLNILIF